jgi:hypothetical protein
VTLLLGAGRPGRSTKVASEKAPKDANYRWRSLLSLEKRDAGGKLPGRNPTEEEPTTPNAIAEFARESPRAKDEPEARQPGAKEEPLTPNAIGESAQR